MSHPSSPVFSASLVAAVAFIALAPLAFAADLPSGPPAKIDFSWRKHAGEFPKDKPGYLILTTEDAVRWSRVLPEFVKQKEAMGFRVYLATEQDYGTGKTGNAQAAQVRAWMREFNNRAGLKYALLIGSTGSRSTDLPSHYIPDGERGGIDTPYCDLDGKWVDIYLNASKEDVIKWPNSNGQGSHILSMAFRTGGGRTDELIVSRINYVGNEIGSGAYDLDRILDKTIRYERDTVAGKNLDWRSNALSVTSNYGSGNWDTPWLKAIETEGGMFELRSTRGWIGDIPPENMVDGRALNAELLTQTRRRGLAATMSHGWALGGEGIMSTGSLFRDVDPRYPAAMSIASCTAFAAGYSAHTGQAWLRTGAIFAIGTSWSGNNNCRVPFQTRQLLERVSVGEAGRNEVVQYGDPSLHVFPSKGTPLRALQISPAIPGDYEERTVYPNTPIKPLTKTYTLTNRSKDPMKIAVETNAPWLSFSTTSVALKPGDSVTVTATSNAKTGLLAHGNHVADVRFRREDGQLDTRQLALALQPLSITACYTFDAVEKNTQFPDLTIVPGNHRDVRSLQLVRRAAVTPENKKPGMEPVPGFGIDAQGKVGGALRMDNPTTGWSRGRAFGSPRWRGISTSFWFKINELPAAKKTTAIMTAPFALGVDAAGQVAFAGNAKPANLAVIKPGEWHFVQLRTDLANGSAKAALDGGREVRADATGVKADALAFGSFSGSLDELKTWSGELTNAMVASEFTASRRPMALPVPVVPSVAIPLAETGELRAPKDIPAALELNDPAVKLDISGALAANRLNCTLRDAPEWLDFKDGVLALKPGADFDRIDFGGYDCYLVLTAKDGPFAGCVCEHTLKVRIPVPEVRIRIVRAPDNTLSIVSANAKQPLAKGVIRYTTDGSPVTEKSPVYDKPFKTEGDKITARFFFLGEYPYMPVTMNSEFGISRELWKPLAVTLAKNGKPGPLNTGATVFDGGVTAWKNTGATLPQFFAWDLGRAETLTAISVQSTISVVDGRIKGYNLLASDDGKTWKPVKSGELQSSPNAVRIGFEKPVTTRYLKLEATSLHEGKDMVIVEIEAYAK